MILADKIMNLRKQMNLSQEQLAEKLSVSRQAVSKWESAQAMPDTGKIIQLAEIFGVTTDYLLKDDFAEAEYTDNGSEFDTPARQVSLEEANEFLDLNEEKAFSVSIATSMFVLSPLLLIMFSEEPHLLSGILSYNAALAVGMTVLLLFVAVGIALIVKSAMRMKKFEYLEKETLDTMYGVTGMVNSRKEKYSEQHTMRVIIGIVLAVLSAVPVLFATLAYEGNDSFALFGVIGLLLMIAVSVHFLVRTMTIWSGFNMLLQEGDFSKDKKQFDKKFANISGIYWSTATALYLIYSFVTFDWGRSWIVWPIAGVVFPIIVIVYRALKKED